MKTLFTAFYRSRISCFLLLEWRTGDGFDFFAGELIYPCYCYLGEVGKDYPVLILSAEGDAAPFDTLFRNLVAKDALLDKVS